MKRPLDEEMPSELEARILRRTAPMLYERRKGRVPKGWLALVFAGGLAAAVTVVTLRTPSRPASPPGVLAAAPDFEMLEQVDLLRDMDMLRSGDLLEKAKGIRWARTPKKKT